MDWILIAKDFACELQPGTGWLLVARDFVGEPQPGTGWNTYNFIF